MKLSEANAPCRAVISQIYASGGTALKLSTMGLVCGTQVEVIRKKRDGGAVIRFRGIRIALGAQAANGIEVTDVCNAK